MVEQKRSIACSWRAVYVTQKLSLLRVAGVNTIRLIWSSFSVYVDAALAF